MATAAQPQASQQNANAPAENNSAAPIKAKLPSMGDIVMNEIITPAEKAAAAPPVINETPPAEVKVKADAPVDETKPDDSSVLDEIFPKKDVKAENKDTKKPAEGEDDTVADDKTPQSAYAKMRRENTDLKRQFDAATQELTTLKSKQVDTAQLETLRAENEELRNNLMQIGVTADPQIQKKYITGMESTQQSIETLIKSNNLSLDDSVADVLAYSPNSKYRKDAMNLITEELPAFEKQQFVALVSQYDALNSEFKGILKNPKETSAKLQASMEAERVNSAKQQEKFFDDYTATLGNDPFLSKRQGEDKWNQTIEQGLQVAKKFWTGSGHNPSDVAKIAIDGTVGVIQRNYVITECNKIIKDLRAELKTLKGVQPKLDGNNSDNPNSNGGSKLSIGESVMKGV